MGDKQWVPMTKASGYDANLEARASGRQIRAKFSLSLSVISFQMAKGWAETEKTVLLLCSTVNPFSTRALSLHHPQAWNVWDTDFSRLHMPFNIGCHHHSPSLYITSPPCPRIAAAAIATAAGAASHLEKVTFVISLAGKTAGTIAVPSVDTL